MRTPLATWLWLGLGLGCLLGAPARAAIPRVAHEPPPSWVEPREPDLAGEIPRDDLQDGVYILLFERQTRVGEEEVETFQRLARRIVAQPGVEAASQVAIEFDPTYQRLDIHSVRIRRGAEEIDAFDPEAIRLLQREMELEYGIYDGTFTATLLLEDVRVGDVVDYAFTVRGQNPVFAGRYLDYLWTEGLHPYRHLRFRLLWPRGRDLFIKDHGGGVAPAVRDVGKHTEYVWELRDTEPVVPDSDLPDWYYWYAWTQLSEFEDWASVAAWGTSVFAPPSDRPESVRSLAARIAAEHEPPRDRLLAALRFVQDGIRYVGIEIGPNSHRPHESGVVMRRRFGDCKDKSLLLVQLLAELGIDAAPALVNTELRTHVESWHPSPYAFDHAVVRATIDGEVIWVDPTRSNQGGGLDGWSHETTALTLSPQSRGLERIPKRGDGEPTIRVEYDFDSPDFDSPTALVITTVARAEKADRLREHFLGTSRDEIRSEYLDFYAQMYDDIESTGEVEFEDDRAGNAVRTVERYRLDGFWEELDDGRRKAWYYPMEIRSRIFKPDTVRRTMPIGRDYPDHVHVSIRARLPTDFRVKDETHEIEDPAFRFRFEKEVGDRQVRLTYEYESLSESVSPAGVPAYLERVDETRDYLTYSLWKRPGDAGSWTTPSASAFGGGLATWLLLMACPVLRTLSSYTYARSGNLARSISYAIWAHRFARLSLRPILRRAATAVELAQLKAMAGAFPEAEALATAALRRTASGGRYANTIHCGALYALCIIRMRQERLDEAQDYLNRVEHAAKLLPDAKPVQRAHRKILGASISANLGNPSCAEEAIREAEHLAPGDRLIGLMATLARAEAMLARGRRDEAGQLLQRGVRAAEETYGPGHAFTREARRELRKFEERSGSVKQPAGAVP